MNLNFELKTYKLTNSLHNYMFLVNIELSNIQHR